MSTSTGGCALRLRHCGNDDLNVFRVVNEWETSHAKSDGRRKDKTEGKPAVETANPAPAPSVFRLNTPEHASTFPAPLKLCEAKHRDFLAAAGWGGIAPEPLSGDASTRRYFRLKGNGQTAILMDASRAPDSVPPFVRISSHLRRLGLSAPEILFGDPAAGLLLLEDFGDRNFARLLEDTSSPHELEALYSLAVDLLAALHRCTEAAPEDLRPYAPEIMLADLELYLEWCAPGAAAEPGDEFRRAWRAVLPLAHAVPQSLLLRDYHAANLMLLPDRQDVRRVGLLDFQDAYRGPVTYDLVSLLEDARRDVPDGLRSLLLARYVAQFPGLEQASFETSLAVVAALRHTRVLAIFERLARHEGRPEYRQLHTPRVARMLKRALRHPALDPVSQWMHRHAG